MPAPKSDPTLSAAQRADAACDAFEQEWRAGRRPRVEDYVAAAPDGERDAVRSALQKVEAELRSGRGTGETSGGANAERTGSHQPRPTPSSPDGTPTHIGRFEVRAVLGAGAFGRVYRAFDPTLDREVAIKVPQPGTLQTDDDRARFLREARSAATVSHPNVCQIYEVGTHDDQPYIVMAMVPGQSLQQALRGRTEPLPERQAAIIARKIALALDAAHKKGVVHRDLKPANVMFDKERKDFVVMDFGLARRAESGDVRATRSGAVMGTPAYMSPEQARGEARDVGPETDIFSLGVMLYEMLAGVRPFAGSSAHEVMGRILLMEPQPPSELRPGLDPLLEAACLKALAKDPAKRFASMGEFAAALDVFLYRPVSPGAETVRPTETKGEGRSVTESQHLGNLFAKMTAEEDEDEDATAATKQPTGKKRAKKAAGPRWPVVGGLVAGLLVIAVAGVVFFTRSGPVKATVELTDVNLNDKTLTYFLDDKPVTADELSRPMELKPNKYVLVVKRDAATVKRYVLTVTGGRRPGIAAEDITPKPEVVQAPPKPAPAPAKKDAEPNPNPPPVEPKPKEPDNAEVNKLHPPVFEGVPWTLAGDELVSNPEVKTGVGFAAAGGAVYFGSPEWAEYDFTFKFKLVGDKGYATARFHHTGAHPTVQSYRGLQFGGWDNSAKDLLNVLNGKWAGRDGGGFARPGLTLDRWYDVIIVVRGEKAQVVFDDKKIFDGANDNFKNGRLGFDYSEKAEARIKDVEVKDPKGRVLWKGVSQLGVAKKEPEPAPVVPKKEPAPAAPSADPFQPGSVWTAADPPLRKLTVVERSGETFRATFDIGTTISRDVTGTVKDGKVSWLAKDVKPTRGGPGGDNTGTLVRRDGKHAIDFEWKGPGAASGTFTLVQTAAGVAAEAGFVPLFNGKDLTGWEGLPGMWKLQGGALVGTSVPAITKNTYLYSRAQYADFELKFDARLKNGVGNSGVQVRSAVADAKSANVIGPQVEVATTFGGLYGEGIGGWLKQVPEAAVRQVIKPNDFNSYHVRVIGKRVVVAVNGTTLVDDTFPAMADRGVIGFQYHAKQQPDELTFRNVLIRDLSAPKPK